MNSQTGRRLIRLMVQIGNPPPGADGKAADRSPKSTTGLTMAKAGPRAARTIRPCRKTAKCCRTMADRSSVNSALLPANSAMGDLRKCRA